MAGTLAKTILTRSLEDIEAGHWKQGTWGHGVKNGRCGIEMGCAMGMVSMHGDYFDTKKAVDVLDPEQDRYVTKRSDNLPGTKTYVTPRIPKRSAPQGVVKSVAALYYSLPASFRKTQREFYEVCSDSDLTFDAMVNACVEYNDLETTGKGRAAGWFRKAIDGLPNLKKQTIPAI